MTGGNYAPPLLPLVRWKIFQTIPFILLIVTFHPSCTPHTNTKCTLLSLYLLFSLSFFLSIFLSLCLSFSLSFLSLRGLGPEGDIFPYAHLWFKLFSGEFFKAGKSSLHPYPTCGYCPNMTIEEIQSVQSKENWSGLKDKSSLYFILYFRVVADVEYTEETSFTLTHTQSPQRIPPDSNF